MSEQKQFEVILLTVTRVVVGFMFLWAFLDKTFGLGRTYTLNGVPTKVGTLRADAWINGGHPTWGFLLYGTKGKYFQDFFSGLADNNFVTFLFMMGLLGIGIAMILGIGRRIAATSGIIMMAFMWTASIPGSTNPIVDSHVINALLLVILGFTDLCGKIFVPQWEAVSEKYPILK